MLSNVGITLGAVGIPRFDLGECLVRGNSDVLRRWDVLVLVQRDDSDDEFMLFWDELW